MPDERNIAQRVTDALLVYSTVSTAFDKKNVAMERLVSELVAAVAELDARTCHIQRSSECEGELYDQERKLLIAQRDAWRKAFRYLGDFAEGGTQFERHETIRLVGEAEGLE